MFQLDNVLELHAKVLSRYGGATGIRDFSLLDSALNLPFQSFGGEYLYPTIFEKAAAVLESIIKNHPFVDGNKRTAYLLASALLLENNISITASEDEKYDFVIHATTGNYQFNEILEWLKTNTTPL